MMTDRTEASEIVLSLEQIPEVKEPMPVMELGTKVLAPEGLLHGVVRAGAPDAAIKPFGQAGAQAAHDGKRLVAFVNPVTGESSVFPLLESLKPGRGLKESARRAASSLADDASLFPKDGTRIVPLEPVTLVGARHQRDGERTGAALEYLAYVRFQREVHGNPVLGPGTRAMAALAGDGAMHGLSHRWRDAHAIALKLASRPRRDIASAIRAQLAAGAETARVTVDAVKLAYYDGGGRFLQPVYHFTATLAFRNRDLRAANRRVTGYVPLSEELEPLPVIGGQKGPTPLEPRRGPNHDRDRRLVPPGDPTVGRYVVRNDAQGWVDSANGFYANLMLANSFGSPIPFTDAQYYWAEPFEFLSDKDSFVNDVNIALTEVHGNWGFFSTRDNQDDLVFLSSIPAGGYGGALAYWILHSCEVIPTATDETTSFDVWWNVFQGMRAAVGYRTEMWIDDGVTSPFGLSMGLGAPVVSAWFNSIASNNLYGANDATYFDTNRQITEPMGRASAIAVCGHGDDTASDIGSLGPASCLTEWWFNN
jgi:Family of unknown function (DUF6345)